MDILLGIAHLACARLHSQQCNFHAHGLLPTVARCSTVVISGIYCTVGLVQLVCVYIMCPCVFVHVFLYMRRSTDYRKPKNRPVVYKP